jgi:CheY-like chemotaxis protein
MSKEKAATILVVESDNDTRPLLKQNLEGQGYHIVVALDEQDALERTSGGRLKPDLILLNLVDVTTEEALHSTRLIRRNAELDGRTPIVVMAERYGEEMEGKDVAAGENEYVTYLKDGDQLHNLLARLLNKESH